MTSTKKKVTLSDSQKYELCLYADKHKLTQTQYIDWIEKKWGVRVNESTITRILQSKNKRLITDLTHSEKKRHKSVTFPELELALKEFVLNYQHRTILSDAILIEKAKLLANVLEIPEDTLKFSSGWLQGFKKRNGIRQEKLQGEVAFTDQSIITEALPLLRNKCAEYPLERIYNIDETGLFYQYVFFFYNFYLI
jgi:hypothetical protein